MKAQEFITELRANPEVNTKLPISRQILEIIARNGGTVNDYWIHNSPVEHVGFFGGGQTTPSGTVIRPMRASEVPGKAFSGQAIQYRDAERAYQGPIKAKKKAGLWLSPLKPFLNKIDSGFVPWPNKFMFLVKLNDDAWLQPIDTVQRIKTNIVGIEAPQGKRKVGQFNFGSNIAVLFEPAFKVVGTWTQNEIKNQAKRNILTPDQLKQRDIRDRRNKELDGLFGD